MDDPQSGDAHRAERRTLEEKYQALIDQIPTRLNERKQSLPDFVLLQIRPDLEIEYQTLRGEILERIKLRQQLTYIVLTIAGAFFAFAGDKELIPFLFPPLAALLSLAWVQNDARIRDAAAYISLYHEKLLPGLGWEASREARRTGAGTWRSTLWAHGGIVVVIQFMAVIVGGLTGTGSDSEAILVVADIVAIAYVIWLFWRQT